MFEVYSGILKMTESFRDDGMDISIRYLVDADYSALCESYPLKEIAGTEKNDFRKALNVLNWLSTNIYHYGNYDNHVTNTAMELLDYAFGRGEANGINCRSLSFALTECLLAIGIKARTVYIMPFSPYDFDNHVVCEAWISDLNKWVMLDPTYNLYVSFNDVPLTIYELRGLLANHEEVAYSEGANYNGTPINTDEITEYYAKDLFRFMVSDIQGTNSEAMAERRAIHIAPYGYEVKQQVLAHIDYRIKKWGNNENLQAWRTEAKSDNLIYKGLDILY